MMISSLTHWRDDPVLYESFRAVFPPASTPRYLTFEVDAGGFNNIRMQFEYMAVIAAMTGRTLVLPPPTPWYLINWGPIKREADEGGVCDFGEFFDISALAKFINVISTAEFIDLAGEHIDLPGSFSGFQLPLLEDEREYDRWELREKWRAWLREHTLNVPWNPLNNLIYYPGIEAVTNSVYRPDERFIDMRTPVEFDEDMDAAPILHFPCDIEMGSRQLGQVSRMVAFSEPSPARHIRALLKHGLRFAPRIYNFASHVVECLGVFQYASLHLRRNEIQFEESRAGPATTARNINNLLNPKEPLYLATDETDESFFSDLAHQRRVIRFSDLASIEGLDSIWLSELPEKFVGCVEQLICAGARVFAGTPHSSFSTYISRIRGYLNAPDLGEHSHTQLSSPPTREFGFIEKSQLGRAYLQEDPMLWEDSDLEDPIYSVSCTDASDYAHWQCELLEYSWKQVDQSGELLRLVSREEHHPLPKHVNTRVISTQFTNTHPETGDHYVPYNRLFSFREWLDSGEQHGTVLILDPDCVFRKRVTTRVKPGAPVAQKWRGYALEGKWLETVSKFSDVDPRKVQGVTWPALVHTDDMRRIMPRWIELTSFIRLQMNAWESDMMAFVVAAAEAGLHFKEQHIAAVLNWPENEDEEAPVIHYCQAVDAHDGSRLWFKQGYEPWVQTFADPAQAKLPYCGDLVAILNEKIALHTPISKSNSAEETAITNSPATNIKMRIYLRGGNVMEIDCKRGDATMQTLFQVLAENTQPAIVDDRLIKARSRKGNNDVIYFRASELAGLETVPD
ncbi:MAG: O-fucosyltransferase family protein [bacterium]